MKLVIDYYEEILGSDDMNESNKPNGIPNSIVDLLVSDIFRKNGINTKDVKGKLTEEQKQSIKELVENLKSQVDAFVNENSGEKQK